MTKPTSRVSTRPTAIRYIPILRSATVDDRALPPQPRQRFLSRPDLRQRRRLVQPAVLHHPPDARRVADVAQRVAIEHLQIGLLAGLDRPDVRRDTNRL